jgi:hypothetical protein
VPLEIKTSGAKLQAHFVQTFTGKQSSWLGINHDDEHT